MLPGVADSSKLLPISLLRTGKAASIAGREDSSQGGRTSVSPSLSAGSSTAKPGPSVASSNSTPPGSWKYTDLNQKRSITGVGRAPTAAIADRIASWCCSSSTRHARWCTAPTPQAPRCTFGVSFTSITPAASVKPYRVHPSSVPTCSNPSTLVRNDAGAEEAANLVLRCNRTRVPRREETPGRSRHQPQVQPVRIDERECIVAEPHLPRFEAGCVVLQARAPVLDAPRRHLERNFVRETVAHSRPRQLRPGEEGKVGAWTAFRIRIEQVVRAAVVLVHALLHQPHPEDADVEVEVLLSRSGDGGDVMQAVDAHTVDASGFGLRAS